MVHLRIILIFSSSAFFWLILHHNCLLPVNPFHTPGQAKITNLNRAVVVHQNVTRLQVPVDDLRLVQVVEPAQNVVDDGLDLSLLKVLPRFD